MSIEDQYELWNRKDINFKSVLKDDGHYAYIDAVLLMNVSIYKRFPSVLFQFLPCCFLAKTGGKM